MAKATEAREVVTLTSPFGTRVTVAADAVDTFTKRGFVAQKATKAKPASKAELETDESASDES
ncbi:MAG: hypothetical protein Q4F67_14880 [Propionibacteriaceae bacterium]|nr:hypothetical protein [Propionibacteriaceae bacterium]